MDFFEMADTDKNGIINYIDFYSVSGNHKI